jgi:hypothetical protein
MAEAAEASGAAATTTSRSEPGGPAAGRSALKRVVRVALAGLMLAPAGCTYTVRLLSDPPGATVTLPDGVQLATPTEHTFRWTPRGQRLVVEAPGHVPLHVDMQRTEGTLGRYIGGATMQRGGREVTFLLQPISAPIGSGAP